MKFYRFTFDGYYFLPYVLSYKSSLSLAAYDMTASIQGRATWSKKRADLVLILANQWTNLDLQNFKFISPANYNLDCFNYVHQWNKKLFDE